MEGCRAHRCRTSLSMSQARAFAAQEVQRIAGTRELSEKLGRSWHSPTIPAGNVALLKKRSFIYLSCL